MATYVTKKCPHCGYAYQIHQSGDQHFYGSPFRMCGRCHKGYIDADAIEIAVSGVRERDKMPFNFGNLVFVALGIFMLVEGIKYEMLSLTLMGLFPLGLATYLIYDQIKNYQERLAWLEKETIASENRLKNIDYARRLADIGYKVPKKYLEISASVAQPRESVAQGAMSKEAPIAKKKSSANHMICPKCKSAIPANSSFCYKCGYSIREE